MAKMSNKTAIMYRYFICWDCCQDDPQNNFSIMLLPIRQFSS